MSDARVEGANWKAGLGREIHISRRANVAPPRAMTLWLCITRRLLTDNWDDRETIRARGRVMVIGSDRRQAVATRNIGCRIDRLETGL